jgi:hypothetical protein
MPVTPLPIYNLHSIPEGLRQLAHRIESGEISAERCLVVLEPDGVGAGEVLESEGVSVQGFGAEPFTRAHAIGLLQAATWEI